MKIPAWIVQGAVGGTLATLVALSAWTLTKVVSLSEDVAAIKATIAAQQTSKSSSDDSQKLIATK